MSSSATFDRVCTPPRSCGVLSVSTVECKKAISASERARIFSTSSLSSSISVMSALFRDGCRRSIIVKRKRVGAHHRLPRALGAPGLCSQRSASNITLLALQAMRSSPATQANSNREVVIVCTRCPVTGSVFTDTAERAEEWKGAAVAFMSVVLLGCDLATDQSSFFCLQMSLRTLPKISQGLERSGLGNVQ